MRVSGSQAGRRVFREDVKEFLLEAILKEKLRPGDRIVESRVAQQMGVSQGPVREALRDLELLGFIESQPFRGSRVRKFSADDLIEIYPVRAAVEGVAARQAAHRIDQDGLRELEACLEAMREAASADDREAHIEADVLFHRTIVEASGNRMLLQIWQSTSLSSSTTVTVALAHRSLRELADRHEPILAALRDADPASAETVMRSHIEELGIWIAEGQKDVDPDGEILPATVHGEDGP
jgi:DNA-binding GntR family transcriptional regulator